MLGLVQRHHRVNNSMEEDRLTEDPVDVQDRLENGGECEETLVSNQQFNLDNELLA